MLQRGKIKRHRTDHTVAVWFWSSKAPAATRLVKGSASWSPVAATRMEDTTIDPGLAWYWFSNQLRITSCQLNTQSRYGRWISDHKHQPIKPGNNTADLAITVWQPAKLPFWQGAACGSPQPITDFAALRSGTLPSY